MDVRLRSSAIEQCLEVGAHASRLVPRGYSKLKPIATNDTAEGRALNRRVMLIELR